MSIQVIRELLLWSSIINSVLLGLSFIIFKLAHKLIFKLHGKWFNLSESTFDSIIYTVLAIYKVLIILFNIVPCVVLYIIG